MTRLWIVTAAAAGLAAGGTGARADNPGNAAPSPALTALLERAAVVKPTAEELKWRRIPWMTDLAAAQRVARQEGRPLLLWASGDDPLERC